MFSYLFNYTCFTIDYYVIINLFTFTKFIAGRFYTAGTCKKIDAIQYPLQE